MSLSVLNKQQMERILLVMVIAATLIVLAFAFHAVAISGLELGAVVDLGDPGINGHCTTTACTAVGT